MGRSSASSTGAGHSGTSGASARSLAEQGTGRGEGLARTHRPDMGESKSNMAVRRRIKENQGILEQRVVGNEFCLQKFSL